MAVKNTKHKVYKTGVLYGDFFADGLIQAKGMNWPFARVAFEDTGIVISGLVATRSIPYSSITEINKGLLGHVHLKILGGEDLWLSGPRTADIVNELVIKGVPRSDSDDAIKKADTFLKSFVLSVTIIVIIGLGFVSAPLFIK
jgi:hypothetical protein